MGHELQAVSRCCACDRYYQGPPAGGDMEVGFVCYSAASSFLSYKNDKFINVFVCFKWDVLSVVQELNIASQESLGHFLKAKQCQTNEVR